MKIASLICALFLCQSISPPPPYKHQAFLDALINCESGGNERAINKVDRDGTSSYGLLQFKPQTLYRFVHEKYQILPDIEEVEIMNVIFDGELQIRVAKRMIDDPEVDLSWEFLDCFGRHGYLLKF